MPACPEMTFSNVTPDRYASLLSTAQSRGLQLTGHFGSTIWQGFAFTWSYDPATQSLVFQCTDRPMFIPCSLIESQIRGLLDA